MESDRESRRVIAMHLVAERLGPPASGRADLRVDRVEDESAPAVLARTALPAGIVTAATPGG